MTYFPKALLTFLLIIPAAPLTGGPAEGSTAETLKKHFQLPNDNSLTMRWIAPGKFQMGSALPANRRDDFEAPFPASITTGFWIAETETTRAQWHAVMGGEPPSRERRNLPQTGVSINDVRRFIERLNHWAGDRIYRLPTEAEWEYACRAGTTTPYAFGQELNTSQAKFQNRYETINMGPVPVSRYPANARGLFDMHGNVAEWTADYKGRYPTQATADPKGPTGGAMVIQRGGAFNTGPERCRCGSRAAALSSMKNAAVGFRLVRVVR